MWYLMMRFSRKNKAKKKLTSVRAVILFHKMAKEDITGQRKPQ